MNNPSRTLLEKRLAATLKLRSQSRAIIAASKAAIEESHKAIEESHRILDKAKRISK